MLLSLDPSSTAIGYALMTSAAAPAGMAHCGVIWPEDDQVPALQRLPGMLTELAAVLVDLAPPGPQGPAHIIVEVPGWHHGKKSGASAGASLMLYGFAAGAVWQLCRSLYEIHGAVIEQVESSAWSRTDKTTRQLAVEQAYPKYRQWRIARRAKNLKSDAGGDASDAIAMGAWWWERHSLTAAVAAQQGGSRG